MAASPKGKRPKAVWEKPRPADLPAPKKLSASQKVNAKRAAAKAGRPYPNLVDNMRAARQAKGAKK